MSNSQNITYFHMNPRFNNLKDRMNTALKYGSLSMFIGYPIFNNLLNLHGIHACMHTYTYIYTHIHTLVIQA
jgi:hypothetical protein